MAPSNAAAEQAAFLGDLLERGLLLATGVRGVYGRGPGFEEIRLRFDERVTRAFEIEATEAMRFPPVLPRHQLETTDYLKSFPQLAGTVFAFEGSEAQAAEQQERAHEHADWSAFQSMTDLVLMPAACYPVYPALAARGPLPAAGVTVDPGAAYVFRHEPSDDPARMQMFHMRELVHVGDPDEVMRWRDAWLDRALTLVRAIGLDAEPDVASDPFFGRGGRMLAASQREQALKIEIQVRICGPGTTAIASFNCHQDHFATKYGITLAGGGQAHTACLGFGHERIVLALLRTHGFDPEAWPSAVRRELWER
jgi:seryl-tRNA synthetase